LEKKVAINREPEVEKGENLVKRVFIEWIATAALKNKLI